MKNEDLYVYKKSDFYEDYISSQKEYYEREQVDTLLAEKDREIAKLEDKCQMHDFFWEGCVPLDDLKKYAGKKAVVYGLKVMYCSKFFKGPKTLEEFGLKRPPQSWCYTEVEV